MVKETVIQKDVNGQELKIGQKVCFTCGRSGLQIGEVIKFGKVIEQEASNIWDFGYINVFIRPLKSEKLRNVKKSDGILILENLFATYL